MYNRLVPSYQKTPELKIHERLEPEYDNSEWGQPYLEELECLYGYQTEKGPEECIHMLIEELYEASSMIDEKRIDAAMYALTEWAGIKTNRLDGGLNVKHGSGRRELIEWHAGYTRALIDLNNKNPGV